MNRAGLCLGERTREQGIEILYLAIKDGKVMNQCSQLQLITLCSHPVHMADTQMLQNSLTTQWGKLLQWPLFRVPVPPPTVSPRVRACLCDKHLGEGIVDTAPTASRQIHLCFTGWESLRQRRSLNAKMTNVSDFTLSALGSVSPSSLEWQCTQQKGKQRQATQRQTSPSLPSKARLNYEAYCHSVD